jgi:two-component system, OmpR family, KDP operon response regulator KdpE
MPRVLVVDDEPQIVRALSISLKAHGYDVVSAAGGEAALTAVREESPDVVVLDLGLPDMDGTAVIASLRAWTKVPILVLSGRHDTAQQVMAFDLGADGYVTKPFAMDELVARLRAAIRRRPVDPAERGEVIRFAGVSVDLAAHRIARDGEEVRLTRTEWQLLEALLRSPGRLMSQQQLLTEVWGPGYETAQGNLRLYMAQLRRKLEPDPSRPAYFHNEPGLGYRFDPEEPRW